MSRGLLQLTSEWAPGAGEHQSPSHTVRTSETSRSSKGSKQLGDMNGGGEADEGTITVKKKRAPKFLVKQFGMITKGSTGASPRRNLKLLGKDYVVAVPAGSSAIPPSRTLPGSTSETTTSVDPDLNAPISEPSKKRTSHVAKPPIEFVTAPVDYSLEKVSEEPPFDFITERRGGSLSRSRSLLVLRSPGGSGSESRQSYTPRSERSVLSVPETVISSAAHHEYSVKSRSRSRATSVSSLVEWSGGSLDRHGELSIAALSIEGEGRNISRRTDITSAQSPASRSEAAHAPGYSPDDTDSGVEMYHETTSASPGSYSRRSSCTATEEWISELEDSDGVSHQYRRSKHRDRNDLRFSSRSQPGSGRYAQFQASKQTFHDSSPKTSHYYDHRTGSRPRDHKRRDDPSEPKVTKVLLGKYGHHHRSSSKSKRHDHRKVQAPDDDMVALDSMTPQEAIAVFHEEVARMMLEEGEECVEANDVEEFLDGYLRLRSPFYSSMVDEFFRAVCVDCYKRPVEVHPGDVNRSGSFSTSSKSLRSTIMPDRGL